MNLAELLEKLGQVRQRSAEAYKLYKDIKEIEDGVRQDLMLTLKENGLKSAKGQQFTAVIAEKPTVVIKNEGALIEWLQNTPDVESDFYIGVKRQEFATLANQMLKESGELADGTGVEVRESLSIKANKKG